MAQVSAASAAAAAGVDDDEIGARIARLGLPATPNVIGKTSSLTNCPHQGRCYCNVYTTMLDRGPELPTIPDSPERDSIWRDERRSAITTPRGNVRSNTGSGNSGSLSNGVSKSVPAKKISLGQYATHKKATVNGAPPRDSKSPAHGEKRFGDIALSYSKTRTNSFMFVDQLSGSRQMPYPRGSWTGEGKTRTGEMMYVKADPNGQTIRQNGEGPHPPHPRPHPQ